MAFLCASLILALSVLPFSSEVGILSQQNAVHCEGECEVFCSRHGGICVANVHSPHRCFCIFPEPRSVIFWDNITRDHYIDEHPAVSEPIRCNKNDECSDQGCEASGGKCVIGGPYMYSGHFGCWCDELYHTRPADFPRNARYYPYPAVEGEQPDGDLIFYLHWYQNKYGTMSPWGLNRLLEEGEEPPEEFKYDYLNEELDTNLAITRSSERLRVPTAV